MPLWTFSPKAFQFWSNPQARPKRTYEAIIIFPDMIFGGGMDNRKVEPFLVKSFSRPGYSKIETQTSEYQLPSGDFAKIDYPTNGFTTKSLRVVLVDVSNHNKGANTAAAINTSLIMQQKTSYFEEEATAAKESSTSDPESLYNKMVNSCAAYPDNFYILEVGPQGEELGSWRIDTPVLTSVDFSDVDYSTSNLATITLTFDYKNFHYESFWGDKLLRNRLAYLKSWTPVSDFLNKGQTAWGNILSPDKGWSPL